MIRLQLTAAQIRAASAGSITLSDEQAASVRGQLNAKGKLLVCHCGECNTCRARERKRKARASQAL